MFFDSFRPEDLREVLVTTGTTGSFYARKKKKPRIASIIQSTGCFDQGFLLAPFSITREMEIGYL